MKRIAWIGFALLVFVVGIQLFPPDHTNPPVTGEVDAPPAVKDVLRRACYDCHSNETRWPWYAWVAPVSWLVANDVEHAREHMNFSQWTEYSPKKLAKIREEIWEEVDENKMPPGIYRLMHAEAALSEGDKALIRDWTQRR